jgi:hypothetical protein
MRSESRLEEQWHTQGDIRLHAVTAGPQDGLVVILWHGFPDLVWLHKQLALWLVQAFA